jgi:hypothetical protein
VSFFGKPETSRELARGYRPIVYVVRLFLFLRLVEEHWAAQFIDELSDRIEEWQAKEGKMSERDMFEKSFQRPRNYFHLSPREQWQIDRKLGILDWNGDGLTDEDRKRFEKHYL